MKAVFDLKEAMDKKMISTNRKVVTFGEVMLRLTAPDFRRFSQTNEFIATYGGSEANVAVSLANFGIPTEFVTRLPDNAMAQACIASLRANGLGTEGIVFGGKRMGLYFLESGASFRNSNVVYDREGSSKSGKTKSDTYQKRKAIFGAKTKSDENNKGDTRNSIAFIITLMMGYTFKSNFTFSSPANNCCVFPILFS